MMNSTSKPEELILPKTLLQRWPCLGLAIIVFLDLGPFATSARAGDRELIGHNSAKPFIQNKRAHPTSVS